MLHPETHEVTLKNGPRPAGEPHLCFYCGATVGSTHEPGCVCRTRSVVVRMTVEYSIMVPEMWPAELVNSSRNGSWCRGNIIQELQAASKQCCLCPVTKIEYIREATDEDEVYLGSS